MKILFFTIGNEEVASSRTRVYQYLSYLRNEGIQCRIIFHIAPWQFKKVINMQKEGLFIKIFGKLYSLFKTMAFIISSPQYNLLFIQRVLLPTSVQRLIKRLNDNIVFDFDDAIFLCGNNNSGYFSKRQIFNHRLEHAIKFSKCVLLENNYTKEYAEKFNKNILVITGPIDTLRYFPKPKLKPDTKIVLGWIGSPTTSSYLEPLYNIFETLSQKYSDLVIKLVGFSPGTSLKRPNIIIKKWTLKTEVADLQSFDIGLMPLPDNDWSRGKGGYKLLQYMAVGIPCVASPVGVNKQIIEEGKTGFIVNTPEEWLEKISILVEDRNLREKMGIEGRKKAEAIYSYQANVVKLVDLLRKLSDVQ